MESSVDAAGNEDTVVRYRTESELEDAGAPTVTLEDGTVVYDLNPAADPVTVDEGEVSGLVISETNATDTDYTYPIQQFSYNVTGIAVGSTILATIDFGSTLPEDFVLLKVDDEGNTTEVDASDWQQIDDQKVQVSITDGGYLDSDGIADGIVVDPITVGVASKSSGGGSFGWLEILFGFFGLGLLTQRRMRATTK
jgi:hypothetical protein